MIKKYDYIDSTQIKVYFFQWLYFIGANSFIVNLARIRYLCLIIYPYF